MASTPGEDTVNTVEITTKDLVQCINLVDKPVAGFERTILKEVLLWTKYPKHPMLKRNLSQKSIDPASSLPYFKKLPQLPELSTTTTRIGQQLSRGR